MNKNKQRRFPFQRQTALLLTGALLAGLLPLGTVTKSRAAERPAFRNPRILKTTQEVAPGSAGKKELKNPTTDNKGITTWDCIWFGNYWQEDTNGDGKADKNDEKTPIKWRVLSVEGDDVFLLADKNLDCQKYNDTFTNVTWETCTMRSWLNGYGAEMNKEGKDYSNNNFLNNAFSADEQSVIKTTNVVNNDNPEYDTEGGNDTSDKVYLLSIDEVMKTEYGFTSSTSITDTRKVVNAAYVAGGGEIKSSGMNSAGSADYWWLRSPGIDSYYASYVYYSGYASAYGYGVECIDTAVRPALHLNLSSFSSWSYAGTVTSEGGETGTVPPMATEKPDSTQKPQLTFKPGKPEQPALRNPRILETIQEVAPGSNEKKELKNPTTENGITTWDCIWFGNYWQEDTNGDGKADKKDEKTPIKWRVLSVDGDDVFLLADKNLDVQRYHDTYTDVTWETCTMRSWLNGYGAEMNKEGKDYGDNNFLDHAFSAGELSAIKTTNVVNDDNMEYSTEGGNDTLDKVFLLSIDEVASSEYGFTYSNDVTNTRLAVNTAYTADGGGMYGAGSNAYWWLRSPGEGSNDVSRVDINGSVDTDGFDVDYRYGTRPALHLNLSFDSGWSYAGTVPSDDVAEWDCVWFGDYWQEDTNGDGKVNKNDMKTPIKWRVLSVEGDDAFLLADKNLDVQRYHDTYTDVTWETCTMRSWLNGYGEEMNKERNDYSDNNFFNNAFSVDEQSVIKTTNVVNNDNLEKATEGRNDTLDKVYLLSIEEAKNSAYGFKSFDGVSSTRIAINTAYTADGGEIKGSNIHSARSNDSWGLRSLNHDDCRHVFRVDDRGGVREQSSYGVHNHDNKVRPALHLNLSSLSSWSYAGTVASNGEVEELVPTPKPTPTAAPIATPRATEIPQSTEKPTLSPTPIPSASAFPTSTSVAATSKPTNTPDIEPTHSPGTAPTIHPPQTMLPPSVTTVPVPDGIGAWDNNNVRGLKKGDYFVAGNIKYRVAKLKGKKGEVAVVGVKSKKSKSLVIPQKVKKEGITFTVTSIQKNAFKGCKKAKKLTIKSTSIRGITKKALIGLSKKIQIKIPKSKVPQYWSALRNIGYSKIDW